METHSRKTIARDAGYGAGDAGLVYHGTFVSMAATWGDDAAFTYGFVIGPIAFGWRGNAVNWLERVQFVPSWSGYGGSAGRRVLWVVARGTGVLVVEQLAVVAMIPALVLALLGGRAVVCCRFRSRSSSSWCRSVALSCRGLMQATADVATWALQVERHSGVALAHLHQHSGGQLRGGEGLQRRRVPDDRCRARRAVCSSELHELEEAALCVRGGRHPGHRQRRARVHHHCDLARDRTCSSVPGRSTLTFAQVFFIVVMLLDVLAWVALAG